MMKGTKELIKTEKSKMLSPIDEMEKWFEQLWMRPFSLFSSPLWSGTRLSELEELSPSVDIYEEGKELVMKADLPGASKDDVQVNITDNYLTITGEKKKEEKVEREHFYRYERSRGTFCRRFELPEELDTDKVKAHFENGVLEIRIPKSEEAVKKSKKITIE